MSYKVKLQLFEGPLDLLLYLVKKDHLNIYDIPISDVTDQYMQYLDLMKILDLNIVGDFLVMAATLLQIKSKMLLPAQENEELLGEDDPRADLVKQLLEYERFKQVAIELKQREATQKDLFKRPKSLEKPITTSNNSYFEASIFDLISAFSKALAETPKELFYNVVKDEFTVEDKVHYILHSLVEKKSINVFELFTCARNKIEMVVTFLAILELIRVKEIVARQSEVFSDIEIVRNEKNIVSHERIEQSQLESPSLESGSELN